MAKTKRQVVSLLLAMAMVLSLLPVSALAKGAEYSGGSGGSQTSSQMVYVYVKVEGTPPTGAILNNNGWYTIGVITMDLPVATWELEAQGNIYNQYESEVTQAIVGITQYEQNKGFELDEVEWSSLKVASGADGYVDGGTLTWHLDGYIREPEYVTITLQDSLEDDGFVTRSFQVVKGTAPGEEIRDPNPVTGYEFLGWTSSLDESDEDEIIYTSEDLQEMSVSRDVIYTARWKAVEPESYTVTYQFASGTDGAALPGSGMPSAPDTDTVTAGGTHIVFAGTYDSVNETSGDTQYVWTFEGWYTDKEMTSSADESITVNQDTVLYGKWTREEVAAQKIPLVIKIKDATKPYNGMTQSGEDGNQIEWIAVNGQKDNNLIVTITGYIPASGKDVTGSYKGVTDNAVVQVRNKNYEDVTEQYDIGIQAGTLTITPIPLTVTVTPTDRAYDGTTNVDVTVGQLNGVISGDTVGLSSLTTGTVESANAGDDKTVTVSGLNLTGDDASNYNLYVQVETVDIQKVELTVKADDQNKTYDGQKFTEFTYDITGFVNGESANVVSGEVTYSGNAVDAVDVGTYTIIPVVSGLSAANYTFEEKNGTLTINQADAPALSVNKTVDQATAKVGDTLTYTIAVENTGNVTLNHVTVTDSMLAANQTIGSLAPGTSQTFTYSYGVKETDAGQTLTNTVTVSAVDDNNSTITVSDTAQTQISARYTVTASIDRGTITGAGVYNADETATITFAPDRSWYVRYVTVNGVRTNDYSVVGGQYVLTIADIDADYTVVVACAYDDDDDDGNTGGGSPSRPGSTGNDNDGNRNPGGIEGDGTTEIVDEEVPLAGDVQLNNTDHFAYIKGYEDGTVRPENNITREEVATIFYRLLTDVSRALYFTEANTFSDVDSSNWSNKAISTLANAGIITGYPDGTFKPKENITRAEFAAIAARFSVVTENLASPFTDTAGHWAESLIAFAADLGWVGGYPDNTFRPEQDITRAEAMTLINNVLDREVDQEGLLSNAKQWVDNVPGQWYYYEVLEATNSHDYERRVEGQVLENWTALTADPVWDE